MEISPEVGRCRVAKIPISLSSGRSTAQVLVTDGSRREPVAALRLDVVVHPKGEMLPSGSGAPDILAPPLKSVPSPRERIAASPNRPTHDSNSQKGARRRCAARGDSYGI